MPRRPPAWFDSQYDNRARIAEHPEILQHWSEASARARELHPEMVEVSYGNDPRERLDVFPAVRAGSPVLVYLHGGYWRALDKRDQSFVAPPFVPDGAPSGGCSGFTWRALRLGRQCQARPFNGKPSSISADAPQGVRIGVRA